MDASKVTVNGSTPTLKMGGVPQVSLLSTILCNVLVHYIDDGTECMLGKSADDTKLSVMYCSRVNILEQRIASSLT